MHCTAAGKLVVSRVFGVFPPMRALLTTHGSTGDIYPVIALGRALREAGHDVRFATSALYQPDVERAGLTFVRIPPDWGQGIFTEFMRELDRSPHPLLQLRHIYRCCVPFLHEMLDALDVAVRECDLLVASYLFPQVKLIADRHKKPFAVFTFCHNVVPARSTHPEAFPNLPFLKPEHTTLYNRLTWRFANQLCDWAINDIIGEALEERGMPPTRNFILKPADLALVAVSEKLMRPKGVHPRFQFTGFLRFQAPEDARVEAELNAFCEGARVPVLTFGSVSFDDVHRIMSRFEKHWPRGQRIIVQSGWAGLSVELARPEIKVLGRLSHDQLFRHASCVIHHGGAGTTASVLHAGVPHIVVPHIADQPFWAAEMERLGVGQTLSKRKWPELLPAAVAVAESSQALNAAAQRHQQAVQAENGRTRSVELLEELLAAHRQGRLPARLLPDHRWRRRDMPPETSHAAG